MVGNIKKDNYELISLVFGLFSLFGSVIAVAFHSEIYQNKFFLKKLFLISAHQNYLKTPKEILI
jgi:hypothetical protein